MIPVKLDEYKAVKVYYQDRTVDYIDLEKYDVIGLGDDILVIGKQTKVIHQIPQANVKKIVYIPKPKEKEAGKGGDVKTRRKAKATV